MNREVDYVAKLRETTRAPVFAVSTDQQEVGRIQGRFSALLGHGGGILYLLRWGLRYRFCANPVDTGSQPPERTLSTPKSYPRVEELAEKFRK